MSEPLFFSPKRKRVSAVEATDDIVSSNFFKSELTETAQKFELSALRTEQDPQLVRSRTRRKSSNNPPLAWSPSHQDSSFDIKSRNLSELLNARQDGKCSNEMEMDENISRLLSTSSDKDTTLSHPPIKKEESTHAWLTEDIHRSEKHGSHDKSGRLLNYSIEKSIFEMANSPSFRLGDFGTPVNHVGSPSVFDSIEYSIGNEDSIDVSPKKTLSHQIECGLSNHSIDNNTSNLFENRSPSGVYYVSDLSNNLLKVHKVRRKQSVVLPLPDLAAFDNSRSRIDVEKGSPICPPTPLRTPLWHSSLLGMTPEHAEWGPAFQNSEGPISIPLIMRQNSLEDNKLLLSQTESPRGDVLFLRDFIIDGLIGTGAFAEVYLVRTRHEADNIRQFAIKKIKRQFRSRKDRDWLLNEVKVMKKLGSKCNYIVEFIRAWQEDSYFYVQLGLASKGSLKDLQSAFVLSNKIFPDYTIWHILHDVVHGLHHIHNSGFVHLDIKPANLLIHEEGYIQIGDFGMASEVGSQEDGHEGDTRYMAPELLNFSERMCSADIFSLGLTILEISYDTQQLKENNIALPTEGLSWQHLRSGQLSIPTCRPTELKYIISDMVNPDPIARPTALRLIERIPNSDSNFLDDEVIMQVQCHPAKSTALFTNFCSISDSVKSAGDTQTLALLDRAITPF